MKSKIYILVFLIISCKLFSQNIITLDDDNSEQSNIYEARDAVIYKPGYHYKPTNNTELMIGRINENIICDVNYTNIDDVTSIDENISTNLIFGGNNGVYGVSSIGATTYSIPIYSPKGIGDFKPSISLDYNSNSRYGIAGAGWNISGISVIRKSNYDYYHDGIVKSMLIGSSAGQYSLDGNRLIYLDNDYNFCSENENFSEIKLHTTDNYFTVKTKNGNILEYGNSGNSKLNLSEDESNYVINWYLNSINDKFGNKIDYNYLKYYSITSPEVVIKSIEYANNKIEFLYQNRTVDYFRGCIKGNEYDRRKLLYKIKVFSSDVLVREYILKYKESNNLLTQLYEIQEKGFDSELTNSIIFDYNKENHLSAGAKTNILNTQTQTADYQTGDFNGDGLTDIIEFRYSKNGDDNGGYYKLPDGVYMYLNNNGTYAAGTIITNKSFYLHELLPKKRYVNKQMSINSFDINSDGKDDFILRTINGSNIIYTPFISTGNNLIEKTNLEFSVPNKDNQIPIYGDFDGDGLLDVFVIYKSGSNSKYILKTLGSSSYYTDNFIPSSSNYETIQTDGNGNILHVFNQRLYAIDYDGDGEMEILSIERTKLQIFDFQVQNGITTLNTTPTYTHNIADAHNTDDRLYRVADINGDNISDLIMFFTDKIYYTFGTGEGIDYENFNELATIENVYSFEGLYNSYVADFNSDGKADIIMYLNHSSYIFYSTGYGFIGYNYLAKKSFNDLEEVDFNTIDDDNNKYFICGIGDRNGDDFPELFFQPEFNSVENNNMTYQNFYSIKLINGNKPHLLSKVRDSFGKKTEFQYANLTDNNIYTKGTGATFPVMDFQKTLPIVKSVTTNNGIGGTTTTNYKYEGAKVHLQGKGFLGFSKIIAESEDLNVKDIKTFIYDDYYFVPYYYKEEIKTFDGTPISQTENNIELNYNLDIDASPNPYINYKKRCKPLLTSSISENYLKGTSTETTYDYYNDDYGNIETITTNIDNKYTVKKHFEYDNSFSFVDNVPVLLTRQTTTNTKISDNTTFSKTVDYTYNSGILETKKVDNITTEYSFDSFGNLTNTTITADDPLLQPRTTSATYDNTGRFLTSKTNILGNTTEYEYNNIWGNVSKIKDVNNKETLFQYDNWGRLIKTTYPTGVIVENSINWHTEEDTNMPTALYYTKSTATNKPYTKTYFDSFGRKLRGETETYGNKIFADTRYDALGRVREQYDTYFEGSFSASNKTVNTYNDNEFGRLQTVEYQNNIQNLTTEFGYIPGTSSQNYKETTELTQLGRTYTSSFDVVGNIVKSQYPTGEVISTYSINGQPISITAFNANTTMEYDPITSQQTGLTDPNSGTNLYEYNQFGELTKQTDGKGSIQNVFLDEYGRTDYTTSTEGQTNIEYVEAGNGIEQVKEIEAPNGYKTKNIYDDFGRTVQTTEIIDGQNYTKSIEYYNDGRLKTETYPSGYKIEYIYNNNSELISIKQVSNNQTIWYCNDYNENGQPNKIYLGNNGSNLKTTYIYDEFKRLTSIKTGNNYEMQYNWNNITGNLSERTDVIHQLSEQFNYDNLDRLTSWQFISGETHTVDYDPNGNIIFKTDVGSYSYDASKVHAIQQIAQPTNAISINKQDITYTSFNKAKTITEGNFELQFEYGAGNYRKKTELLENGTTINTRIFAGNYEKEILEDGTIKEYHYISGPTGLIAIYIKENGNGQLYYTATDHLGSICQILEPNGTVVEETNYDPWGNLRDANTWELSTNNSPLSIIYRGYTGHEHLPQFAIINMNGRMYDPVLARMLSPDNYVQSPGNPQNYNRYAYVLNNPLKYTDPSGESWFSDAIGFVAGVFLPQAAPSFSGFVNYYKTLFEGYKDPKSNYWEAMHNARAASADAWVNDVVIASPLAFFTYNKKEGGFFAKENIKNVFNKLTYQSLSIGVGQTIGLGLNQIVCIEGVADVKDGDIIVNTKADDWDSGFAFGNILYGDFSDYQEGGGFYSSETYGRAKGVSLLNRKKPWNHLELITSDSKDYKTNIYNKSDSYSFDYYEEHNLGKKTNRLTSDQIQFMMDNDININNTIINWHYVWQYNKYINH